MDKYWTTLDAGFKIVLALVAAWSAYVFGYRKQQNEDITLVTSLLSDSNPQRQIVGIGLAEAFVKEGRIPESVFTLALTNVRDASPRTDPGRAGGRSVKESATIALNKAADENTIVRSQLDRANGLLPIRIYFHAATEADRREADMLGNRIENVGPDAAIGRPVIVPPTELIQRYAGKTELRCFRASECQEIAPKLITLLRNSGVASLAAAPVDLSRKYEDSKNIRPYHFELWFAAGQVPR